MGEKRESWFRRCCLLRVERAAGRRLQGEVKAVPCSAGLHFVLCVMSALEHGLLHTGWGAQVMDMGGGEPRAAGHPCLTETLQQVLYSFSAELVLYLSPQVIFHGQQLWPVWFTYVLPFLVAFSLSGNSISHWDSGLCPNLGTVSFSCLSLIVQFPLLRCNLPFSVPNLCFL